MTDEEARPQDYEPNETSADWLLLRGSPAQAIEGLHPKLYEHWKEVVSESTSRIEPQFEVAPIGPIETPPTFPTRGTWGSWSGSVAYPWHDPVTTVAGEWTVPTVADPGDGSGVAVCATWIGIDGWTQENALATDILQAGTTQLVGAAFAWWQWVPGPSREISNLAVSAGDVMFCVIRALSPTEATFYLVNKTTGTAVLFSKPAPDRTKLRGACAEWIVELPQGNVNGQPLELGNFGSVTFDHCVAYGSTDPILYPGQGELLTMVNPQNYEIAVPTVLADDSIRIDWTGGPPQE